MSTAKRHSYVMVLAFLYAGFSLVLTLLVVYHLFWRPEGGGFGFLPPGGRGHSPLSPWALITSAPFVVLLAGGLISLFAGYSIWQLTRKKEVHAARHGVMNALLLPNEARLIGLLKASENGLTQSRLVVESGLSKVQVHRIVKKLESQDILSKHKYGLTNKLVLAKDYAEPA